MWSLRQCAKYSYSRYGRRGASSRVRLLQFLPTLSTRGMSFSVQPLLDDEYVSRLYRGKRTRAVKSLLPISDAFAHFGSRDIMI